MQTIKRTLPDDPPDIWVKDCARKRSLDVFPNVSAITGVTYEGSGVV